MHTIGFKAVQRWCKKGLNCIEAGRVPHMDYVYVKAMSKNDPFMKFDRN